MKEAIKSRNLTRNKNLIMLGMIFMMFALLPFTSGKVHAEEEFDPYEIKHVDPERLGNCEWGVYYNVEHKAAFLEIKKVEGTDGVLGGWEEYPPWNTSFYSNEIVYVQIGPGVKATTCKNMFSGLYRCYQMDLSGLDTSMVTDMSNMFSYLNIGLTSNDNGLIYPLDVSGFDTRNVTNMANMFNGTFSRGYQGTLDVSGFNTSKVTDMSGMFGHFTKSSIIGLKNLDTSSVKNMSKMFISCWNLNSIDVSKFNTSKVTDMSGMFSGCANVESLNLSNFKTSNVNNMDSMFCGCKKLRTLNTSGWDTSKVTDMGAMFEQCAFTSLDLSRFNTSRVTDMGEMFLACDKLGSLNISGWDTSKVATMERMFSGCSGFKKLDLSALNTSAVVGMRDMFGGCTGLTYLDLSHFKTPKLTTMTEMFGGCTNLVTLDLTGFDNSKITDMMMTFKGCGKLRTVLVGDKWTYDPSRLLSYDEMFKGCKSLVGGKGHKYGAGVDTSPSYFACVDGEGVPFYDGAGLFCRWKFDGFSFSGKSPDYTGAKAKFKCRDDGTDGKTITAAFSKKTVKKATTKATGSVLYKASVTGSKSPDKKAHKVEKKVTLPKILPVKSVIFEAKTYSIPKGTYKAIKHTIKPSNATKKTVTYKIGNEKIATVDKKGKVHGLKAGKTTLKVTTDNGKKTAECSIVVTDMAINKSGIKKKNAGTSYKVTPTLANDTIAKVTTSNKKIATVTLAGNKKSFTIKLTKRRGKATLTVKSSSGITKKLSVKVDSKIQIDCK